MTMAVSAEARQLLPGGEDRAATALLTKAYISRDFCGRARQLLPSPGKWAAANWPSAAAHQRGRGRLSVDNGRRLPPSASNDVAQVADSVPNLWRSRWATRLAICADLDPLSAPGSRSVTRCRRSLSASVGRGPETGNASPALVVLTSLGERGGVRRLLRARPRRQGSSV